MIRKLSVVFACLACPAAHGALAQDAAPTPATEAAAIAVVKTALGTLCEIDDAIAPADIVSRHELTWKYDGDAPDQAARKGSLFVVPCFSGAYNFNHAYVMADEDGGLRVLSFAVPAYRVVYEDDDFEKSVLRIDVTGMTTTDLLTNSEFDAESGSIDTFAKWRGVGDASSSAAYQFANGHFELRRYDVDASYDGAENPATIYDADAETP